MNINAIAAIIGYIYVFFTILALVSPSKHARIRSGVWDFIGAIADRVGLKLKKTKEE